MKSEKILVIGAYGQIGTELTHALCLKYGRFNVVATDVRVPPHIDEDAETCLYLDVMNRRSLDAVVLKYDITQIYLLAAVLSATGEQDPVKAWNLNMQGLLNVLECAREHVVSKIFWPSSIAVFGQFAIKKACPQHTVLQPSTMYGISKAAGEDWCNYYFKKFGVDVRSIRFPGLISHSCLPGGGTTDYAVDIFYQALSTGHYTCFLKRDTVLPMLYMADAIEATIALMETPADNLSVRTSYNIGAVSFSPEEIASEIKKIIPSFQITYEPDYRQGIAETWPQSLDDRFTKSDWNWKPRYNLPSITTDMLSKLSQRQKNVVY